MATATNTPQQQNKVEEQNLVVALRTRPLNEEEIQLGATAICHCIDNKIVVLMDPQEDPDDILRAHRTREKQFIFDHSLDGSTSQEEVYQKTSHFVIPSVVKGYNATVFAYGATGAGKTYTMLGTDDEPGIMARSLNDLFAEMDSTSDEYTYKVSMSYLEIYNEMIRDLLNPETGFLDLREDAKGVQVPGLSEISAQNSTDVMEMLVKGNKERTQEPTAANKTSSRSHAILQVNVRQRPRVHGYTHEVRTGKLFLIDLAGSERAAATHNRGKRMVEGAHINRSLLALGNCINALSENNGAKYVNFRDSKLTRLLKDSLGGNCKTVMIAHVSPASIHFEETRNTLLYGERAKHIKTKVRRNVMDVQYHIHQYTNIIRDLREEVKRLKVKLDQQQLNSKNTASIQAIQTEVLEVAHQADKTDLTRLKEQLIHVFHDQMELRRSLMELDNTAMEIRLETARNQLLIQKWDKERALAKRSKEKDKPNDHNDLITDVDKVSSSEENLKDLGMEKEKGEKEEENEPEEVRGARDEMLSLQDEKDRTDRLKSSVRKELENAREKATKIEQLLPKKVNSKDQQEILGLLVKSHELEIENMEMQSACLLKNFEIRRKDMVIAKYRQHLNLCDEIIQQQRVLIDEYEVPVPKDLDDLYELYTQEEGERPDSVTTIMPEVVNPNKAVSMTSLNRRMLESDSMSDMDKLNVVDEEVTKQSTQNSRIIPSSSKEQLLKNIKPPPDNDEDTIFSRSVQAQQILEAQARALASVASLHSVQTEVAAQPQRQRSIITLSSHSASPTPPATDTPSVPPNHPSASSKSRHTPNAAKPEIRREEIASKTRNIAALAAARRTKAQLDAQNSERLSSFVSSQGKEKRVDDMVLTASRLAQHDSRYGGSNITLQHLIDDDLTVDESLPTLRNLPQPAPAVTRAGRFRHARTNPPVATKKRVNVQKRARSQDIATYPSLSPQSFFRQLSKTTPARRTNEMGVGRRPRITPPATKTSRTRAANRQMQKDVDDSIREFEMSTPTTSVHQSNTEKGGRGLTVQKRVRGHNVAADSPSTVGGTPRKPRAKRPPPTIPAGYRKTDIAIAGFGISGNKR